MAINLSFLKRLVQEDFEKKDQPLIGKIAFILNPALDQIVRALDHGISVSDLNTLVKDITISVDSTGKPITTTTVANTLSGKCSMILVGRAQNLTNTQIYPTSGHSVSFTLDRDQIIINNITGLTPDDKWSVRLIACV
jgi:hypothetical protein